MDPLSTLPEEISALRVPISSLFLTSENAQLDRSERSVTVFDFVKQKLRGGVPVHRMAASILGQEMIDDNEQALGEVVALAEMLIEARKRRPQLSRPTSAASSSTPPPRRLPHPPPTTSTSSSSSVIVEPPERSSPPIITKRENHLILTDAHSSSSPGTTSPSGSSSSNNLTASSFEYAVDALFAASSSAIDVLLSASAAAPPPPIVVQLRALLEREKRALLSDADDLRRSIAPSRNTPTSSSSGVPSTRTTPTLSVRSTPNNNNGIGEKREGADIDREANTSRVRAVLLARMNQRDLVAEHDDDDDDDDDKKKKKIQFDDDGPEDLRDL